MYPIVKRAKLPTLSTIMNQIIPAFDYGKISVQVRNRCADSRRTFFTPPLYHFLGNSSDGKAGGDEGYPVMDTFDPNRECYEKEQA